MRFIRVIAVIIVYLIPVATYVLANSIGIRNGHKYALRLGWVAFLIVYAFLVAKVVFPWLQRRE